MKKIVLAAWMCAACVMPCGAEDGADKPQKLDPIVVTPSRYEESVVNSSKSVTLIGPADIEASQARTVPELLKRAVGVDVRDYTGTGKMVSVDIGGFGESANQNVLVLIDGRRTNQVDISGTDWAQIDIDAVERIEVVRAPQSVLYGDNATGGVVNIVTKKGKGAPSIGAGVEFGSYRYRSVNTYIAGGDPFLDYRGSYSYARTDGYRVNGDLDRSDYNMNLTVKPTEIVRFNVSGGYHNDWYGMPGAMSDADIGNYGRDGSVHPNDRAKTEDKYVMFGPDIKWSRPDETLNIVVDFLFRGRRTSTLTFGFVQWENENHIVTRGITPRAVYESMIAGRKNKLLLGVDYYYNRDNIFSGDPTAAAGKDLIVIEKETIGFYGSDQIEVMDNVFLNAGGRGEWAMYDFDQQSALKGIFTRKPKEYAWEAGATAKYNERSSVYLNASRSYRFPAVDEWYNALWTWFGLVGGGLNLSLKPQTQLSCEAGIREQTLDWIGSTASVYVMDVRKELFYNPVTFTNDTYDRTTHAGFNVESHFYPMRFSEKGKAADTDIDMFGRYNYNNAYFVKGTFAGNEVPMAPKHRWSSGVSITYKDCVNFNYLVSFVGRSHLMSDQRNIHSPLKAFMTNDVRLTYSKHGFKIFGSINNIFDVRYAEYGAMDATGTIESFYPSPGRNFLVGISQKF